MHVKFVHLNEHIVLKEIIYATPKYSHSPWIINGMKTQYVYVGPTLNSFFQFNLIYLIFDSVIFQKFIFLYDI